jgi:hypothetical protein
MDDESLDVGSSAGEELSSADGGTDDYRGVVKSTIALASVVRRRHGRTKQHVSNFLDARLETMLEQLLRKK